MNIFFFPMENYVRELDGRCSIISQIKKISKKKRSKFIAVILPKNIMYFLHRYIFCPYSVLGMSLQSNIYSYAKSIKNSGGFYYFLEEEYFDRFSSNSIRFGSESQCKHVFASTKTDYDSLKKRFRKKISFTGNPRIDVLNDLHNLYKQEIIDLKKKFGTFFLFNSTFSYLNSPKDLDYKFLSSCNIFKSKRERDTLIQYLENHKKRGLLVRDKLIDKNFAREFDNVIYRPHPNESLVKAKKMFESSNVIVESSGNVLPWIAAAKSIGHSGCTTAVESFLISKNIQFFFPFSKDKAFLSFKVSDSYLDNNEKVVIRKQSASKLVTEQLPNKQSQKVPNYASYQIASKLYSNSKSANFLLFVLGVLISLVVTLKKVIYIYLDEKETIRRNANVKKAAKRYNLKNFISLNNLGILIVYKF